MKIQDPSEHFIVEVHLYLLTTCSLTSRCRNQVSTLFLKTVFSIHISKYVAGTEYISYSHPTPMIMTYVKNTLTLILAHNKMLL